MAEGMAGLDGWIEIFRTGKHAGKNAEHLTFTRDDLDQIANRDISKNPIPHIITHDQLYSPFAYGQGVELKRDGDSLYVKSININEQFQALIESGALFERSVRLIKDSMGWKLDHIAWLGAEPPAVEGLEAVSFSAAQEYFDFQFIDTQTPYSLKRLARAMRNFVIDKFDIATADKVIPEYEIEDMEWNAKRIEEATAEDNKSQGDPVLNFNKQTGGSAMPATREELDDAKEAGRQLAEETYQGKLNALETKNKVDFAAEVKKRETAEWKKTLADAITAGRLTPAQAEGALEFTSTLDDKTTFEFSRADKSKVNKPNKTWFADFVAELPVQVAMQSNANGSSSSKDAALDNTDADAIALKAVQFKKEQADKGVVISVSEAVYQVTQQESK